MTLKSDLKRAIVDTAKRSVTDPTVVLSDEALKIGIARSTLTEVRILVEFGTQADVDAFLGGKSARVLSEQVKANMKAEDLAKLRARSAVWTPNRRELLSGDSALWGKFSPALRGLTELPKPPDMVALVKSNRMREQAVDQYLDAAFNWMEEFKSEWIKFRAAKPRGNSSNPGESSPTAGTQQPEPSPE